MDGFSLRSCVDAKEARHACTLCRGVKLNMNWRTRLGLVERGGLRRLIDVHVVLELVNDGLLRHRCSKRLAQPIRGDIDLKEAWLRRQVNTERVGSARVSTTFSTICETGCGEDRFCECSSIACELLEGRKAMTNYVLTLHREDGGGGINPDTPALREGLVGLVAERVVVARNVTIQRSSSYCLYIDWLTT